MYKHLQAAWEELSLPWLTLMVAELLAICAFASGAGFEAILSGIEHDDSVGGMVGGIIGALFFFTGTFGLILISGAYVLHVAGRLSRWTIDCYRSFVKAKS